MALSDFHVYNADLSKHGRRPNSTKERRLNLNESARPIPETCEVSKSTIYNRMQMQLLTLERHVRALRAELENELVNARPLVQEQERIITVGCAMDRLLSGSHPFSRCTPAPYEHFFPDLNSGYKAIGGDGPVAVTGLSFAQPSMLDSSTCLVVDISTESNPLHEWCTIETSIDSAELRNIKSFTIKLGCSYRLASEVQTNFHLALRLITKSDAHTYCQRAFPVLNLPFEFVYHIGDKQWGDLPLADVIGAKLLIMLPFTGMKDYSLIISHCEMFGRL